MAIFQRTLTAAIAATALAGAFSLPVQAAETSAPAPAAHTAAPAVAHAERSSEARRGHDHHRRHSAADKGAAQAKHLEQLKARLQLQPEQQAAWDQYVAALKPVPRTAAKGERRTVTALTTPERLDLARQMRETRNARANQRDEATRSFYASLSADQQKRFDAPKPSRHGKPGPRHSAHPSAPVGAQSAQ